MNETATQASQEAPARGPMRFTYPSGARPLDGYTIKRGVGRGGFGEVYYAVSDGGKEVAIKLIRRNLDVELRGVSHCLNLKHPNLVCLYDIRQDDLEDSWVIMEYVSGESLEELIDQSPDGMPIADVLHWIHSVGAGVTYLHEQGIVHRDLKPGNLFNDQGIVKIGDYGLSKFISASRRSGQTESVGTVHYMAPEIANGRYGKEIDIYALGVILYEMLTGHVPFEGESVGEVLMKHLTAEPDLQRVPATYRGVIAKALTKDPGKRYTTVREMLNDLPMTPVFGDGVTYHAEPTRVPQPNGPQVYVQPVRQPSPQPQVVGGGDDDIPYVHAVDEEPVLRAIRQSFNDLRMAWNNSNFHVLTKVVLIFIGIALLLSFVQIWIPALVVGVICYGTYRVARSLLLAGSSPFATAGAPPRQGSPNNPQPQRPQPGQQQPPQGGRSRTVAEAAEPIPARGRPQGQPQTAPSHRRYFGGHGTPRPARSHEKPMPVLVLKSGREKFTELLGSFLLSGGVAAASVILSSLFMSHAHVNQLWWLAMVSAVGSWMVLLPSKFWEGTHGEPLLRRGVMMVVGVVLGLLAYLTADWLMVDLYLRGSGGSGSYLSELVTSRGTPAPLAYVAYFGFLFPIIRWWRQADPLRTSRMSIGSVLVCMFWAYVLSLAWPFPQPWGVMVAAVTSLSVQLSAPWIGYQMREGRR